MASRKKSSSQRRYRGGDFLALLLLIGLLGGLGWRWHLTHARKKAPAPAWVVKKAPQPPKIQPSPIPVVLPPARPAPPVQTNAFVHSVPSAPDLQPAASPNGFPRPVRDVLEAQVALARRAISPGSIDEVIGSQTRLAIAAFQRTQGLNETGLLDTNTRLRLTLDAPLLTNYTVTSDDLARLQPLGKTWLEKSQQTALDFETELELVAEQGHAHPALIRQLNPGVNWMAIAAGTVVTIPGANYPEPDDKAARVVIHLAGKYLEAFDFQSNLMLHCPCSIAAKVEKRPVGELHVVVIAPNPNYTVNPELFPESAELQALGHKLILPPGPNNPVGVAWIGLDRPGYGMHGTPAPEQVGRTESHGCFRLANWDAAYLLRLAWIGLPVEVQP